MALDELNSKIGNLIVLDMNKYAGTSDENLANKPYNVIPKYHEDGLIPLGKHIGIISCGAVYFYYGFLWTQSLGYWHINSYGDSQIELALMNGVWRYTIKSNGYIDLIV